MTNNSWQDIISLNTELLCVGCIKYEDVFGKSYETVFCWEYQGLKKDFYPSKKYKFNYRT